MIRKLAYHSQCTALIITFLLLVATSALAQFQEGSYSASSTGQDLVDVDFVFIGAHPDDESGMTATMARYVLDQGFKGTVITLTQGEGGGNATGLELGPSLGIVRSEELRRSLEEVGIKTHYFTGQDDFYYTLFAEEAQELWGNEFICDAVRIVRMTRPEVIVSMWPGPGTHGAHQMAARTATIAYNQAGNPDYCPEQLSEEYIEPWRPLKLYYTAFRDTVTLEIPTDEWSRTAYMRYADLKALALANFRSQGFDQFFTVPVEEARPERFILVKSRVPVAEPETHLLAGAVAAVGNSPVGIELEVTPETYQVGVGQTVSITATLTNHTGNPLEDVQLSFEAPDGFTEEPTDDAISSNLADGESLQRTFTVSVADDAALVGQHRLAVTYSATMDGAPVGGRNYAYVGAGSPVEVSFKPLFDIANYRTFAQETGTEWVIPLLSSRVPITVGADNELTLELTNYGSEAAQGQLSFDLPEGVSVNGDLGFDVPAGETVEKTLALDATPAAVGQDRQSAALQGTVTTTVNGYESSDQADIFVLPTLTIQPVGTPPTIDGDLSDMQALPEQAFSFQDLWSGEADNAEDTGASFYVGYDDTNLYIGVEVQDQSVVCNIAPDDIRGHWRSDSVEITIDPSGDSSNTSSTFKTGIFPCTTEGFTAAAERDADANQGPIEQTAPGMTVASTQTDTGYTVEASIPWADMPAQPAPGDSLRFNVIVYDGDQADAGTGANIGESRAGWASVDGAQQAVPYFWPTVQLGQ